MPKEFHRWPPRVSRRLTRLGVVGTQHRVKEIKPRLARILSNWKLESLTWVKWPGWLGPGQDVGPGRGHAVEKEATGGVPPVTLVSVTTTIPLGLTGPPSCAAALGDTCNAVAATTSANNSQWNPKRAFGPSARLIPIRLFTERISVLPFDDGTGCCLG